MSENGQTGSSSVDRLSPLNEDDPMRLDVKVCRQAMLSKDARFDGRFFVGVRSTGIYCRPICPAPTPKAENVNYYTTASAAAEAGFRPCLRCRPEAAPGSDPWRGTAATVSRALRLIGSGELEEPRVSEISAWLGISSRQLGRLFHQHLGAAPKTVARTHRLQFAKKLLDETDLSIADVAFSAGFGSIRRFNAIMQETYGRTPTQVRRLTREGRRKTSDEETVLSLQFRPPYDWTALLDFFLARAIPGVESVDDRCYRRTIDFDDSPRLDRGIRLGRQGRPAVARRILEPEVAPGNRRAHPSPLRPRCGFPPRSKRPWPRIRC